MDYKGESSKAGDNQKWALALQNDGSYKLRAKHSGKYLGLTEAGIK
jgi:hypothetical protein